MKTILIALSAFVFAGQVYADKREDGRFKIKGAEVLDMRTGLFWARCNVGQVYDVETDSCTGQTRNNLTFDAAQRLSNADWRVPTREELLSLPSTQNNSPPHVNEKAFPNQKGQTPYGLWTNEQIDSGRAYIVTIHDGWCAYDRKGRLDYRAVRLVRRDALVVKSALPACGRDR